jgi:hypothetical protein
VSSHLAIMHRPEGLVVSLHRRTGRRWV